ncbi:MAG: hypothetical protein ABEJ40_03490 [Haloarculaceae archaeon]
MRKRRISNHNDKYVVFYEFETEDGPGEEADGGDPAGASGGES